MDSVEGFPVYFEYPDQAISDEIQLFGNMLVPGKCVLYMRAFEVYDNDRDGYCSLDDVPRLMRAISFNPTDAEVDQVRNEIKEYCKVDKTKFHLGTWMKWVQIRGEVNFKKISEEALLDAFRAFDSTGTGKLTLEDFRYILQACGDRLTPEEADAFIDLTMKTDNGEVVTDGLMDYYKLVMARKNYDEDVMIDVPISMLK